MTEMEIRSILQDRLAEVEARIQAACQRANRQRSEVTLIAVTKSVGISVIAQLPDLGIHNIGESRPQQLVKRFKTLKSLAFQWHMIGHLQRNKVAELLECDLAMIHSVDSLRLLEAIQAEAAKKNQSIDILLEVNASREEAKHGFQTLEMITLDIDPAKRPNVKIKGLMAMAAVAENPEGTRPTFREVKELALQLNLPVLSMGMSDDFEVAIEEGATHVRIGSVIFNGLPAE
jgi:PLP dependent protein